jgi:hypothetical protein
MMPSTIVQKIVICVCITDFAITPEINPIRTYQIKWNILFPPSFVFRTSSSISWGSRAADRYTHRLLFL